MNRIILPFESEKITDKEIQDHIYWYAAKAEEGMKLVGVDNRKAMNLLREINRNLKEEHSYYEEMRLSDILYTGDELKNRYFHAVLNAYVKQNKKTSYDTLSSNLYNIHDYMLYN